MWMMLIREPTYFVAEAFLAGAVLVAVVVFLVAMFVFPFVSGSCWLVG
jgi:hypothetical protein